MIWAKPRARWHPIFAMWVIETPDGWRGAGVTIAEAIEDCLQQGLRLHSFRRLVSALAGLA